MNVKIRLLELGKKQVDLVREIQARGYNAHAPFICNVINGTDVTPRAQEMKKVIEEILTEWEKSA